ncbi:adenylyl cyclase-associated protein, partial [Trifolium pratense]
GMSMPVAHVEESWQMDEFYSNKSFHALGPVWSQTGKVIAPSKANASVAPSAPPHPPASLFSSESLQASSSKPKVGMSAFFQEIGTRDVTAAFEIVNSNGNEVQCQVPLHLLTLIFRFTTISGGGGTVYCLANVINDEVKKI